LFGSSRGCLVCFRSVSARDSARELT
jgi:hypothetical protein